MGHMSCTGREKRSREDKERRAVPEMRGKDKDLR